MKLTISNHPQLGVAREVLVTSFIVNMEDRVAIVYYRIIATDSKGDIIKELSPLGTDPLYMMDSINFPVLDKEGNPKRNPLFTGEEGDLQHEFLIQNSYDFFVNNLNNSTVEEAIEKAIQMGDITNTL